MGTRLIGAAVALVTLRHQMPFTKEFVSDVLRVQLGGSCNQPADDRRLVGLSASASSAATTLDVHIIPTSCAGQRVPP